VCPERIFKLEVTGSTLIFIIYSGSSIRIPINGSLKKLWLPIIEGKLFPFPPATEEN